MSELDTIKPAPEIINAIATVEGGGLDKEEVVVLYDRLQAIKRAAAETVDLMKKAMVEWIGINGEIEIGDVRYYAGIDKDTKPRKSPLETYRTLVVALGGDEEAVMNCLSSNAWRHGAIRKALDEAGHPTLYAELFETVEKSKLSEGKPIKSLQVIDRRFLK